MAVEFMTANNRKPMTWRQVLSKWGGTDALFDAHFFDFYGKRHWGKISDIESNAAHLMHVELISRIATQPLGYSDGSEASALDSIYGLFSTARELCKSTPRGQVFEPIIWHVMNTFVRPFTAKWHPKSKAGQLRALDCSDLFRTELTMVQKRLIALDAVLALIANAEWPKLDVTDPPSSLAITTEMASKVGWRPMGEPSSDSVTRPRSCDELARLAALSTTERKLVSKRRIFYGRKNEEWASGIALSGGGIRSATFAMGVLVALSKRNLLKQFDYLSTVSGGGYSGSFLTQLLGSTATDLETSLKSTDLPFKRVEGESLLLQRFRHGASFLTGGFGERFAVAMTQAQGIFINILVLVLLISVVATLQVLLNGFYDADRAITLAPWFIVIFALWSTAFPFFRGAGEKTRNVLDRINIWICAALLIPSFWAGFLGADKLISSNGDWNFVGQNFLVSYVPAFVLFSGTILAFGSAFLIGFSRVKPFMLSIFTGVFILISDFVIFRAIRGYGEVVYGPTYVFVGAIILLALLCLGLDINSTSLHHYYRKKLSKAFLLRRDAESQQSIRLSQFDAQRAMFPILNCALNVPGSKRPEMRGRQSDVFSLTPVAAGANLISYRPIADWEQANPQLDLATAMALSGAAVSPQMGQKTSRYVSFWLTLLNLRLNLWLKNPAKSASSRKFPNVWNLGQELLATADENSDFLNISDGGHIENLGVYELLRRRCRFILAIDGENDGNMTFHALTNLQRLAYIDHGIVIDVNLEDLRLSAEGLSRSHFRFCRIRYPTGAGDNQEQIGYLVYLKLSLTGNEGEFIRRYKSDEPAFPHHPTSNQFFTEVQFEAYRALGEHVGDKMFLPAITGQPDSFEMELEDWFRGLGKSFLEPV
jgi:hypothetical protein